MKSSRRGVGILLVVILAFIVILSIIGIAQRSLTSAVTNQTLRASVGDLSLELAESAVEESLSILRRGVNDPTSPIFQRVRRDVYATDLGPISFLHDSSTAKEFQLKNFEKLLADQRFSRFFLKENSVDVVYQRQFDNLPYERFSLVKLRSRVQFDLSITESVGREVEIGVGMKMVLIAPPRPFDQATLLTYVPDAGSGLSHSDLNTKRREYVSLLKEVLETAERYASGPATPEPVRADYGSVKASVQPPDSWDGKLPDLPTEALCAFAAKGNGQSVGLEDLFVFKKIDDREKGELTPARKSIDRQTTVVARDPTNVAAHREMASALRAAAQCLNGMLKLMLDYRETFHFWMGTDYEALVKFLYKLEPDHWSNNAFYTVSSKQGDVNAQIKKLFSTVKPINGVLRIDNDDQQVNLDTINIRGKLVVAVTGSGEVKVSNLNIGERPNDLLTIVAVRGPMRIANEVHAALISTEGNLSISPGSQIYGILVAGKLPSQGDRQCTITRLDKYYSGRTTEHDASGAFKEYYYVGISPRLVYKKVTRR